MKRTILWLLPLLSLLTVSITKAAVVEYSSGHGDIGLAYEDGELELHYHFGNGAVLDGSPLVGDIEYAPSEAAVRVGDDTRIVTTGSIPFLGTSTSDPIWVLPQSGTDASSLGVPFLGIAADELDSTFSAARLRLTSFSGPGEFALFQSFGSIWETNDGLYDPNAAIVTDTLNLTIGGHDHFNFGFTAEGIYDVGISAEADFAAGGMATDFGNFRFVVGSATAIPEPGSFAVLAIAGLTTALVRRRRK